MDVTLSLLAFLEGADLVIVAVVIMVLFGGSQLPKLARNLGQAKKELDAGLRVGEQHDSASAAAKIVGPRQDQSTASTGTN